jgi:beta-N-acetylhexosaminidase
MTSCHRLALSLCVAATSISAKPAQKSAPREATAASAADVDGWVEGKLQSMNVREKIGQMLMVDVRGTALTPDLAQHLWDGAYGNVIFFERNVVDSDQVKVFVRQLQDNAVVRGGVPLLVAVDQEGGQVNRLGEVLGMKSARYSARTIGRVYGYDRPRAEKIIGDVTADLAERMRDLGFNMNLAPVLDLTDDTASYIYDRSYGGDPNLVAAITGQYADVMRSHGIVTTGKHFPNLSVTRPDSHHDLPTLDRRLSELRRHEFMPFKKLKDKLGAVMVGHVMVPSIDAKHPASVSVRMGEVLRQDVGFKGVVISDDLKMRALTDRYGFEEMLLRAVYADVDMLIVAWGREKQKQAIDVLERAVAKGWLKPERLDASVRRILTLKRQTGR